jgi:hypothetical protein
MGQQVKKIEDLTGNAIALLKQGKA